MSASIVIFGATGDLTSRKLIPGLYSNFRKKRLPEDASIIGFSRTPWTDEEFRKEMRDALQTPGPGGFDEESWGPSASDEMLWRDGRWWTQQCGHGA